MFGLWSLEVRLGLWAYNVLDRLNIVLELSKDNDFEVFVDPNVTELQVRTCFCSFQYLSTVLLLCSGDNTLLQRV